MVIDTSVGCAAGGKKSVHPTSINCRDFLIAVLDLKYLVVMNREISKEWKKHRSRFSRIWYASMIAKKRVVPPKQQTGTDNLYNRIEKTKIKLRYQKDSHAKCVSAMLKDYILIEAAINTDKIIVSLDEQVRYCFGEISSEVKELKRIIWVNPDKNEDAPMDWLKEGAKKHNHLLLGK